MTIPSGSFDPAKTSALFRSLFPSVMLPMFLAVSDQTIVASALPAMAAKLGDVERVSWVVVSYLLAATIAAPLYGYLGDVFGRRRLMFFALALFMAASVPCAVAPSILLLAGARALQGLGGGGLMSLSQALIGEVVPPRQRGHYQGYMATVATTSSVFGPVAGGFLTEQFGWESIFLINLPLGLLAVFLVFRLKVQTRVVSRLQNWSFDTLGLVAFVGFIVPVLIALEQARQFDPRSLPMIVGMFALAVLSFVLLVAQEKRANAPLFPIDFFAQPAVWRANGLAMCHGAALTSLVAFLPIYLRVVHGMSASETGLMLVPISIGIGTGSIITGRLVTRTGRTTIYPAVGLMVSTAVLLFFALTAADLGRLAILLVLIVSALFMGTAMTVVQLTVQVAAGRRALGKAAGSVQFSRTVGAAFGTALAATVLFASLSLSDPEAAGTFAKIVDLGTGAMDGLEAARRAVLRAEIAAAFRNAFLLLGLFTAVGSLLAWTNPLRRI